MTRTFIKLLTVLAALVLFSPAYGSRIKDLTKIQGIRTNQLTGFGLVTGLAGTGDSTLDMTNQAVSNMVRQFGININPDDSGSANVAIVMVNANIGAFAKPGDPIDITVSALGDAATLQGGYLQQTPLTAANGQTYAVAMGPVQTGGFIGGDSGPGGSSVQKNHPTVGVVTGGATVERPINTKIVNAGQVDFKLHNPDLTTAVRMADAVNRIFPGTAQAMDPATVNVLVPAAYRGQTPNFIASVNAIEVEPDSVARVVINERTGTIVATSDVRISEVAISYGSLVIEVTNNQEVSQPGAFSQGETTVTNATDADVTEERGRFAVIPEQPSLTELVDALNKLGVTTRDMINILQTLKQSGALQAELVVN